jgi:hypothetical protein
VPKFELEVFAAAACMLFEATKQSQSVLNVAMSYRRVRRLYSGHLRQVDAMALANNPPHVKIVSLHFAESGTCDLAARKL